MSLLRPSQIVDMTQMPTCWRYNRGGSIGCWAHPVGLLIGDLPVDPAVPCRWHWEART